MFTVSSRQWMAGSVARLKVDLVVVVQEVRRLGLDLAGHDYSTPAPGSQDQGCTVPGGLWGSRFTVPFLTLGEITRVRPLGHLPSPPGGHAGVAVDIMDVCPTSPHQCDQIPLLAAINRH